MKLYLIVDSFYFLVLLKSYIILIILSILLTKEAIEALNKLQSHNKKIAI